jgi:5-hydroxyisourate hydrolase
MNDRLPITTHILDLVTGKPAAGVAVSLYLGDQLISTGQTDADGRVESWEQAFDVTAGKYRLEFDVEPWFTSKGKSTFYEDIHISFRVDDTSEHYHVPLLLSPYGYSTYRGS